MKTKTVPRGLYVGSKRIAETEDEQWEIIRDLAASLNDYINDNAEHAANILRGNGIDPDALFDIVKVDAKLTTQERKVYQDHGKKPPQSREWEFLKWAVLQRDSLTSEQLEAIDTVTGYEPLSPEAHQAITVILQCRVVQRDLDSRERRDTLCNGIRLATAIEHLNADIAWLEPVDKKRQHTLAAIEHNEKRRKETKQTAEDDWQPRCDELFRNTPNRSWHDIAIDVGSKFDQSYSTIKRHCKDPTKA